ncbi:MAG TPA: hypothetical protein VNZ27_07285 [Rhodanobacter sp.]|jgi:hypothetical protein|nr:hypothetical protein [Rhodanobacter sp.]
MKYVDALIHVIDGWNSNPIVDEWIFEKFRVSVVANMSASEAFNSINETVNLLLAEADESTATEILQTLIGLAHRSETTEVPSALLTQMEAIKAKFSVFGDYAQNKQKELFKYYRLQ